MSKKNDVKSILEKSTNEVIKDVVKEILPEKDRRALNELPDIIETFNDSLESFEEESDKNINKMKELIDYTKKIKDQLDTIQDSQNEFYDCLEKTLEDNSELRNLFQGELKSFTDNFEEKFSELKSDSNNLFKENLENLNDSLESKLSESKDLHNTFINKFNSTISEVKNSINKKMDKIESEVENSVNNSNKIMKSIGQEDDINFKEYIDRLFENNRRDHNTFNILLGLGVTLLIILHIIQMIFF